jgi:peptidoglycan/LPS O-acetylase OafA/YrhL
VRSLVPPGAWAHRPHLDGLRAVAATLVVLFHAGAPAWPGGFVGVDVFFVLSGFLITGVWLSGRRDPLGFYARRARRLLPAALTTLLATAAAWRLLAGPVEARSRAGDVVAAALYVSNWRFVGDARDYFAHDLPPSPVLHFWSLAVEEQFYLVWPWVLLGLLAVATTTRSRVVTLAVLAGVAQVGTMVLADGDPVTAHFGTHARAYQLLLGALLAAALPVLPRSRLGPPWIVAGLSGVVLSATGLGAAEPVVRGFVAAMATAALLVGAEVSPDSRLLAPLRAGLARRLGAASYSAYLVHWPLVLMADQYDLLPEEGDARTALVLGATWGLALLLHAVVERPALAVSLDTRRRRRAAVGLGLLASGLTALAGYALLTVGITGGFDLAAHFETAQPSRALVHGAAVDGPRVLVVGDSHAEHWWTALAAVGARHGWDIALYWVPACGWAEQPDTQCREAVRNTCAADLRAWLHAELARTPTDLVVLGSYMDGTCAARGVPVDDPGFAASLEAAAGDTVDRILRTGAQVLILEPVPDLAAPPLTCVDADLGAERCPTLPVEEAGPLASEAAWRRVAASRTGVGTVDLDAVVCPAGACPTVVDGRLTRRDVHHLQPSYAATLADGVTAALAAAGLDLDLARLSPRPTPP